MKSAGAEIVRVKACRAGRDAALPAEGRGGAPHRVRAGHDGRRGFPAVDRDVGAELGAKGGAASPAVGPVALHRPTRDKLYPDARGGDKGLARRTGYGAAGASCIFASSMPQTLKFQRPLVLQGHTAAVYALAVWRDGILSGGGDGLLVHWAEPFSSAGRVVAQIPDRIFSLLPLDGAEAGQLVVGTLSGDLYWIDTVSATPPRRWALHRDGLFGLCANDVHVYAVGGEGGLSRWRRADGTFVDQVQVDTVRLRSIAYLPTVRLLVVGTAAGDLRLIDPQTLRTVMVQERAHEVTVFSVEVQGEHVFTAGRDGAIRVWEARAPFGQVAHVAAHAATVNCLAVGPEGWLASAGRDREVRLWQMRDCRVDLEQGRAELELTLTKALTGPRDGGHVHSVNACCWYGQTLVSAGDDRTVRVWGR